jgi:low affinity Fe/Cu permease
VIRYAPGQKKKAEDEELCAMKDLFHKIAQKTSEAVGSAWAFMIAIAIITIWAVTGPIFGYSDTWQLIINTGTTIVTFLMVFLIQNTQNRDAKVIHLKLDELIRVTKSARNHLVDLEDLTDDEIKELEEEFRRLRERGETQRKKKQQKGKG